MKEIKSYILFTITASWICWIPLVLQSRGLLADMPGLEALKALGALSPAVTGLILTFRADGRRGVAALLKNSFTAYRTIGWLLFAVCGHMVLSLGARLLMGHFEPNLPKSEIVTGPVSFISFTVLVFFLGGGLDEEIGWRGFMTERLLKTISPVKCILITGSVWIIWHLPLFYITGSNQSMIKIWEFILPVAALNIIITWLYIRTRSVLLCALFHTFGNVFHEVFRVMPTESASSPLGYYFFTVIISAAAVLIMILDVRIYEKDGIMN